MATRPIFQIYHDYIQMKDSAAEYLYDISLFVAKGAFNICLNELIPQVETFIALTENG